MTDARDQRLTIRSSRARFAASCKFLQVSLAQGREAARLNSGVRPVQEQMPVNKRQAKLAFFSRLAQAFDPRHKLRAG